MSPLEFRVIFRGVRGSYPAPGKRTCGFGGNTPCVEVRAGGHLIIIDAGTGLIPLGEEMMDRLTGRTLSPDAGKPIVATILLSHTHYDHIQGFPFFKPAFVGSSVLYLFGPKLMRQSVEEQLANTLVAPFFPIELDDMDSVRVMQNIKGNNFLVYDEGSNAPRLGNIHRDPVGASPNQVRVNIMKSFAHPKGGVLCFKVSWGDKSVVYASDTESYAGQDTRLTLFCKGADLLIHDSQYTYEEYVSPPSPKQGYGHSTPEMATAIAKQAGVKQLALFHHDPLHDDTMVAAMEEKARALFPTTFAAYEGMEVVL